MEEKTETKINENENKRDSDSESKHNTKTEEATNMEADTEVVGGSGLRQHVESFHKRGATAARMEDNNLMEGTGLIKGTISGQAIIIDGWDGWESDDIEEEKTMNEKLIKQQFHYTITGNRDDENFFLFVD